MSEVPASVFIPRLGTPRWQQFSLLSDTRSQIKEGPTRGSRYNARLVFPDRKQRAYHYLSLSRHFTCGRSAMKSISHLCYIQESDSVKRLPNRAQAFVTEGHAWAVALILDGPCVKDVASTNVWGTGAIITACVPSSAPRDVV